LLQETAEPLTPGHRRMTLGGRTDFLILNMLHTFSGVINPHRARGLVELGSGIAELKFMWGVRHPKAELPFVAQPGR